MCASTGACFEPRNPRHYSATTTPACSFSSFVLISSPAIFHHLQPLGCHVAGYKYKGDAVVPKTLHP